MEEPACGGKCSEYAESFDPAFFSGKMFPDCSLSTVEEISPQSSFHFGSAGISDATGLWTLNFSEFPNEDGGYSACSLRDVLEPDAPPKYSLSAKAAAGIIRRAEKRGKALPEHLAAALKGVANATAPTD